MQSSNIYWGVSAYIIFPTPIEKLLYVTIVCLVHPLGGINSLNLTVDTLKEGSLVQKKKDLDPPGWPKFVTIISLYAWHIISLGRRPTRLLCLAYVHVVNSKLDYSIHLTLDQHAVKLPSLMYLR